MDADYPPRWVIFACRFTGRYVHRIAITNNRILALDNGKVTFRYQNSDTRQWQRMTLPAKEFLRRYLQHVLPQGFHKVRYYGLLSPANRLTLKRLQLLLAKQKKTPDAKEAPPPSAEHRCPCCEDGVMVVITWLPRRARSPPGENGRQLR